MPCFKFVLPMVSVVPRVATSMNIGSQEVPLAYACLYDPYCVGAAADRNTGVCLLLPRRLSVFLLPWSASFTLSSACTVESPDSPAAT